MKPSRWLDDLREAWTGPATCALCLSDDLVMRWCRNCMTVYSIGHSDTCPGDRGTFHENHVTVPITTYLDELQKEL